MSEPRPMQGPPLQGPPRPAVPQSTQGPPRVPAVPNIPKPVADLDPISLVDEPAPASTTAAQAPVSKIKGITGAGTTLTSSYKFQRTPHASGQGAIRVRSFHGRLSEEGLIYMDEKINEWIDQHPEIEVKFATTTIGQFEGKIREPALVVNIWY